MISDITYRFVDTQYHSSPLQVNFELNYEKHAIHFRPNYQFKVYKVITKQMESKNNVGHLVCKPSTFTCQIFEGKISDESLSKLHLPSECTSDLNKGQIDCIAIEAIKILCPQKEKINAKT